MQVLYAILEHRKFIHLGYPSKPVLADVAAQLLNKKQNLTPAFAPSYCIPWAGDTCFHGLLVNKECGHPVGYLLLTIAHDNVIMLHKRLEPVFHVLINVLFCLAHHKIILDEWPVTAWKEDPSEGL